MQNVYNLTPSNPGKSQANKIEKMRLTDEAIGTERKPHVICSVYSAYLQAKRHVHIRLNIRSR